MRLFLHHQEAETGLVPSVQDFDKKLAEADAYLQILIDQLKVGLRGARGLTTSSRPQESFNLTFRFETRRICLPHIFTDLTKN